VWVPSENGYGNNSKGWRKAFLARKQKWMGTTRIVENERETEKTIYPRGQKVQRKGKGALKQDVQDDTKKGKRVDLLARRYAPAG